MGSRKHGGRDGRSERAGLTGARNLDSASGDVGIDLHQHRILLCNSSGTDNPLHGNTILTDPFDDRAGPESRGLDQRAVDLGAGCVKGLADDAAGQERIDEDRAVTIVPVKRQQAALAGPQLGRFFGESAVQGSVTAADPLDPPLEDVSDG